MEPRRAGLRRVPPGPGSPLALAREASSEEMPLGASTRQVWGACWLERAQSCSPSPHPEEPREAAFLPLLGLQEAHSCPRIWSGSCHAAQSNCQTQKASLELPSGPAPHGTPRVPSVV